MSENIEVRFGGHLEQEGASDLSPFTFRPVFDDFFFALLSPFCSRSPLIFSPHLKLKVDEDAYHDRLLRQTHIRRSFPRCQSKRHQIKQGVETGRQQSESSMWKRSRNITVQSVLLGISANEAIE